MITAKVMFIECARRKGTVKYVLHITTLLKHIPGAHSKHLLVFNETHEVLNRIHVLCLIHTTGATIGT